MAVQVFRRLVRTVDESDRRFHLAITSLKPSVLTMCWRQEATAQQELAGSRDGVGRSTRHSRRGTVGLGSRVNSQTAHQCAAYGTCIPFVDACAICTPCSAYKACTDVGKPWFHRSYHCTMIGLLASDVHCVSGYSHQGTESQPSQLFAEPCTSHEACVHSMIALA
jgi:hypothetical protein